MSVAELGISREEAHALVDTAYDSVKAFGWAVRGTVVVLACRERSRSCLHMEQKTQDTVEMAGVLQIAAHRFTEKYLADVDEIVREEG